MLLASSAPLMKNKKTIDAIVTCFDKVVISKYKNLNLHDPLDHANFSTFIRWCDSLIE
jgi:hypothetical protein